MTIVHLTPGAGGMYCGNCFRDNALVAELRKAGHSALLVPLYLPLTVDEEDQSAHSKIFFSGINVFLEQKSALFRRAPEWLHHFFESRKLLQWVARRASATRAEKLGELTLSMLRGEEGNQKRELEELISWLKSQRPDVICLSNALLMGMTRRLRASLGAPIVCTLQGEDYFLDALPQPHRAEAWSALSERAADVDLFIAPSRYFADVMIRRLGLEPDRVRVVLNGIDLIGYSSAECGIRSAEFQARNPQLDTRNGQLETRNPPSPSTLDSRPSARVLGYFARMCKEKGLDTLVDAFLLLKQKKSFEDLKLWIGGGCGPSDVPFVNSLRARLKSAGFLAAVEFHPNLNRADKIAFLQALSVFAVPAMYGEAFGLYIIEAWAAGVPVVQPRTAAFPELIAATGGGVLFEPQGAGALAEALESLLVDPDHASALGNAGKRAVFAEFSAAAMARKMVSAFEEAQERFRNARACPMGNQTRQTPAPAWSPRNTYTSAAKDS